MFHVAANMGYVLSRARRHCRCYFPLLILAAPPPAFLTLFLFPTPPVSLFFMVHHSWVFQPWLWNPRGAHGTVLWYRCGGLWCLYLGPFPLFLGGGSAAPIVCLPCGAALGSLGPLPAPSLPGPHHIDDCCWSRGQPPIFSLSIHFLWAQFARFWNGGPLPGPPSCPGSWHLNLASLGPVGLLSAVLLSWVCKGIQGGPGAHRGLN